jgi:lipoprotein-anchoring transpeptidase ErfK/SrfK
VRTQFETRASSAFPDGTSDLEVIPSRNTRFRRSRRLAVSGSLLAMASVALALPAGAQSVEPVIVPPAPTTVAPTTVAPVTTVAPTTVPPTTVAPEATTTVATTIAPPTSVAETVPVTATPTTKKKKTVAIEPGNLRATGSVSLEVSIARQIMIIRKGGDVWKTIPVSTGSGRKYCNKGKCGNAVTPRGRYRIYSRVSGWRTAALGRLYNPLYFKGGFAVHGSGSVPRYPASHGCVRVSIANARWLPSAIPNGTSIWIH